MDCQKAILVLEDGKIFYGLNFGAEGETIGEVCFNTGMTGYQEILTDPSYCGQIVTMTYPHIGNYGVNPEDVEILQDLVLAAVNDGLSKAQEMASSRMGSLTGGMNFPGLA